MNKVYSLLGLSKRAGKIVSGETACVQAIRSGQAVLVLVTQDASQNTVQKFQNACHHYQIPLCIYGNKEDLGKALGTDIRAVAAITETGFGRKISELLPFE